MDVVFLVIFTPKPKVSNNLYLLISENCLGLLTHIVSTNCSAGDANKEVMSTSILVLVQHLAARTPDKTEYRLLIYLSHSRYNTKMKYYKIKARATKTGRY